MANKKEIDGTSVPIDPETSQQLHRAWLATRRSAVATLGFDPRNMVVSPAQAHPGLGIAGFYQGPNRGRIPSPFNSSELPKAPDTMWYDANYKTTPVHESMHRGISMLVRAGRLPNLTPRTEELVVRALMSKHYGDAELGRGSTSDTQIKEAREKIPSHILDYIEQEAADLHARRIPRGPR